MTFTLYDHTDANWDRRYSRHGRENGAATYSRELVRYQAEQWSALADDVTVSTCPLLYTVADPLPGGDIAVQYLHTYPYANPLSQAVTVLDALKGRGEYGEVIFVVAYKSLRDRLRAAGFSAEWVPMTIDVASVIDLATAHDSEEIVRPYADVAWYGNMTGAKLPIFNMVRRALAAREMNLVPITGSQEEAFPRLIEYEYGVGVGRCALEMMALGVKVMVAGERFGGIVTTEEDHAAQHAVNYNGRVITYDRDPVACIDGWPTAIVPATSSFDAAKIDLSAYVQRLHEVGSTYRTYREELI